MSDSISQIPEFRALESRARLLRIPHEINVPITDRIQHIIDTAEFQRLARISQLGLVSLIYPGANHTRFEHSLGVYRKALQFLQRLQHDARFVRIVDQHAAEVFLVAALLHDLGHWPYCHLIEDMRLPGVPQHELFANSFLLEGEIADALREEWDIAPREVVALLSEKPRDNAGRLLASLLSGPIDIDKMDYLYRDSLHAGVPYGYNFDQQRLIGSLCLNEAGDGLALTDKGRTAAEMMVFSRYIMFSEVYWHHAVRAASAMLQRAFFLLHGELDVDRLFRLTEHEMAAQLVAEATGGPASSLLSGIFGPRRRLYKRWIQLSYFESQEIYEKVARRPYAWLVACAENLADILSRLISRRVAPHEVIIDAPPVKLEVQFDIDVYSPKHDAYRNLGEVSPVIHTLAHHQFDDFVKRVRVFVSPELSGDLGKTLRENNAPLQEAIQATDG